MTASVLMQCLLIGCVAGLRSMMAPAIVCAGAYIGWVHLGGTPLAFMNSRITLAVFTLLAILELFADKLPQTPARIASAGLITRMVTGGLSGAAMAVSGGVSLLVGAALGVIGGIVGAYVGYFIRRGLVAQMRLPDFAIAVVEDLLTISGGLFVVSRLQ